MIFFAGCKMKTYPDSRFRDVRPDCDLFSGAEIRIPVPGEHGLEFLQLLRREMGSLSSLSFTAIDHFQRLDTKKLVRFTDVKYYIHL